MELDKERRIVIDDLRAQEDNLGQVTFRLFHSGMWREHPYRLDPLGTADSVAGFTRRKAAATLPSLLCDQEPYSRGGGGRGAQPCDCQVSALFAAASEQGSSSPRS